MPRSVNRSDNQLAAAAGRCTLGSVDLLVRRAAADDFTEIAAVDGASFGVQYSDEDMADVMALVEPERFLVAVDGTHVVGVTGDFPFTMTLPGGALDVPGVSWVSVDPTYRRRGILRELMHRQLGDYVAAGVPAAILTASEGGIYGRFGYGVASQTTKTVIDRRRAALARPGNAARVERVSTHQALERLPDIYRRWVAVTPGALSRSNAWWHYLMLDRESQRGGKSALFHVVHSDGYVSYRVKEDWNDGDPRHICWITDYAIVTAEAHAALWQVLLGLDLFGSIETFRMPLDDPLQHLLTDGRRARPTTQDDGLWLRPLDVVALLGARTYAVEVDTVIEVRDDMFGDARYRLRGGPDGADCRRTDSTADVTLGVGALGSVSLGGVRLTTLARAGHVVTDDQAMLTRLDRALLADRMPVHGTAF